MSATRLKVEELLSKIIYNDQDPKGCGWLDVYDLQLIKEIMLMVLESTSGDLESYLHNLMNHTKDSPDDDPLDLLFMKNQ